MKYNIFKKMKPNRLIFSIPKTSNTKIDYPSTTLDTKTTFTQIATIYYRFLNKKAHLATSDAN